jgi:mannose-6-phosphate isomerase
VQWIYLLEGKVQHYSWGGYDYIPSLLQVANSTSNPFAEYWLGAHPAQPSLLVKNDGKEPLHQFIGADPEAMLGQQPASQFGALPFLLKILDVRQMLSIQVHPNLEQAAAGFEKENAAGIPLEIATRNYKDANHKPELMVALSDFWLLHGFKPEGELLQTLKDISSFEPLISSFEKGGYKVLFEEVMAPDSAATETILKGLLDEIVPLYEAGKLTPDLPHFWAARAFQTFCKEGRLDKGIFSIYFFNLLHLKEGEAIFQDAGLPHAYLKGQNVEIMANSDNVLRAGLTDKHVDIPELLKLVRFEPTYPKIIAGVDASTMLYESPAAEFQLTQYRIKGGEELMINCQAAAICFLLNGKLLVSEGGTKLEMHGGTSCFCMAGAHMALHALEDARLFVATVPNKN